MYFESETGKVGFNTIITDPMTIYQSKQLSYDQLSEPVLKIVDNYTTIQVVNPRGTTSILYHSSNKRAKVCCVTNTGRERATLIMVIT
jgi:hypothetical protein